MLLDVPKFALTVTDQDWEGWETEVCENEARAVNDHRSGFPLPVVGYWGTVPAGHRPPRMDRNRRRQFLEMDFIDADARPSLGKRA